MHIPDGLLSPSTCVVFDAVMVPVWVRSARRVGKVVKSRNVPLLAMAAAFAFLVMMFNIPVPDGTTAHAVGAVIIAILLGPEAAVIAVSIALVIQALFFGDGGVLALGVNCFNMAVVMPYVGYAVYRLLAGKSALTAARRAWAAGVAGYVGIVTAAFLVAIQLGVQPDLFHAANGAPLYSPYHFAQTIPAMLLAHLTVAGIAEFAISAGIVAYLQRANVPVLRINHPNVPATEDELSRGRQLGWRWALVPLAVMVVLTPLGLLAPGTAFGESSAKNLDLSKYHLSAVPTGFAKLNSFWNHALLGGYGLKDGQHPVLGYLLSAVVGIAVVGGLVFALVGLIRLFQRSRVDEDSTGDAGKIVT